MVRHPIFALLWLPFLACAAAGGGGSGGSGGAGGTGGGTPGTGGSGAALPDFLSHGPYPFPQSKASGSCTLDDERQRGLRHPERLQQLEEQLRDLERRPLGRHARPGSADRQLQRQQT